MSTTAIEVFKPVGECSGSDLYDGIVQGLWLARALFVALSKVDDTEGEKGALAYLGSTILAEVEEKQKALAERNPPKD
jgi:hypothetical protein